jgi:hypothetical protein
MKPLIFEAIIICLNGAEDRFIFHADDNELAANHAQHVANCGTAGHDWNKKPDYVKLVKYRKLGLKLWKAKYATRIPVNS